MGKRGVVLGLCISLNLILSIPCFAQATRSLRVIQVNITRDGHFVPERILVKQDQKVVFRVTAYKSDELTWPPDVLHGFYLMYDQIVLIGKTIKAEDKEMNKATIEVGWVSRFAGEFTLRCPYHQHKFGTVIVRQRS